MPRLDGVHDDWWSVISNIRMHALAKCLYFYLKTSHTGVSGIYKVAIEEIAFKSKVAEGDARHLLTTGEVVGVQYDDKIDTVFVEAKFEDALRTGGRPDLMHKSILNDYFSTPRAKDFWLAFSERYADYISAAAVLSEHFNTLRAKGIVLAESARSSKKKAKKQTDDEINAEIQALLARYARDLDAESRDVVYEAYEDIVEKIDKVVTRRNFLVECEKFTAADVLVASKSYLEDAWPGRIPNRRLFILDCAKARKETNAKTNDQN